MEIFLKQQKQIRLFVGLGCSSTVWIGGESIDYTIGQSPSWSSHSLLSGAVIFIGTKLAPAKDQTSIHNAVGTGLFRCFIDLY